LPVEAHGISLGRQPMTIGLRKYEANAPLSTLGSVQVQLDPNTRVVPVNVVVVLPSASIAPEFRATMEGIKNVDYFADLTDDQWGPGGHRISPAGEPIRIQGTWLHRNVPHTSVPAEAKLTAPVPSLPGLDLAIRPDDIFAQCGIQFRLASVVTIEEDTERGIYMQNPDGGVLCINGGGISVQGILSGWRGKGRTEPSEVLYGSFDDGGVTIMYAYFIENPTCANRAVGTGLLNGQYAAIGLGNQGGDHRELTLAHEIGHALGMDDLTATGCNNNLMCQYGGGETAHIAGCELRDGQPVSPLPYNCIPVSGETIPSSANCAVARQNAGSGALPPAPLEPPAAGSSGWTSSNAPISYNTTTFTQGTASLSVSGGYSVLTSPSFLTTAWRSVGDQLAVDVYIAPNQPNPYWLGSLDFSVDIPAAGINSAYLGHVELTGLPTATWNTVQVPVSAAVEQAFLGDYPV
jgi:hypothetical protein